MDLGRNLMQPSFDNPRGFWENQTIVDAHETLLNDFERDWSTATFLDKGWENTSKAKQTVEKLIAILSTEFQTDVPSLVKDPRLTVLHPLWQKVAKKTGRDLNILAIVRSPSSIASSIEKRNVTKRDTAEFIALSYLESLVTSLPNSVDKIVVYEKLVGLSAQALLGFLRPEIPLVIPKNDDNLINQLDSFIFENIDRHPANEDMHRSYLETIDSAELYVKRSRFKKFVSEQIRSTGFTEIKADFSEKRSLLPSTQIVEIDKHRLDFISTENLELSEKTVSQATSIATLSNQLDEFEAEKIAELKAVNDVVEAKSEEIESLNAVLIVRDKELNDQINQLNAEISTLSSFKGGIEERDKVIKDFQKKIDVSDVQLAALQDGIKERDLQIRNALKEKNKIETARAALAAGVKERDKVIYGLNQNVYEVSENLELLKTENEELIRTNESMNLKVDLESKRSAHVENLLNSEISNLKMRLAYYENYPVKAAGKAITFKTLQTMRHKLPLPETFRSSISQNLSGVAHRLQPPALRLPAPTDTNAISNMNIPSLDFAFQESDTPVISIIVPVYNEISQTITCLKSIYQQQASVDYEVILADDCSPDPFHTVFEKIEGLRYFRNPKNLGFLQNCNTNAAHARGDYILFLNNDTLVKAGWLESLYRTFLEHGNVGVVGSKLVFPTGELQEAGGIIWEDASGWNWGRGQNPDHPLYNFVRDVDYVSGASFMIIRDLFEDIGGFYSGLEKAYYEDTDCCFRVREKGYRVLYQPESLVIHIEGLSSGTDVTAGAKKYQLTNQKIFHDTWQHVLKDHFPNADRPHIASDRLVRGHVLYIDTVTPEIDKDAGSVNAFYSMRILIEMGYRVHFIPGTNFAHWGQSTKTLQSMGVECIYHPFYSNMETFLKERGDKFDYVILSRAEINEMYLKQIRKKCPSAKVINNTVDLHYLRMEREAELTGDENLKDVASKMKEQELAIMKATDATIVLSSHEYDLLSKHKTIQKKLWNVPLIQPKSNTSVTFNASKDIVFIGGYKHPPNVDAVEWLVDKVWPAMQKKLPEAKLIICGSSMPDHFKSFASEDIIIKGFVPDLDELLSKTRLTIAPLRFGAGQKGKVTSSFGAGVPCVGTDVAFEGMPEDGLVDIKLEAKSPEDFAALASQVYNDEKLWNKISKAGLDYYDQNFAYTSVAKIYGQLFDSLKTK